MNNKGFTLLEMLMVVFIIATLLILTIPNITKHKTEVEATTCDAYQDMIETQVVAYEMIEGSTPSVGDLVSGGYIDSDTCPDGSSFSINGDGEVVA